MCCRRSRSRIWTACDICDDEASTFAKFLTRGSQPSIRKGISFIVKDLVSIAWTMKQIHLEQAIAPKAEEAEGNASRKGEKLAADKRQLLFARKSHSPRSILDSVSTPQMAIPASVEVVKKAVAQINFDDESVFPPEEAEIYRRMKREGARRTLPILEQAMAKAKEGARSQRTLTFASVLSGVVFDLIGEAELLKYIPFNDVRFFQVGHHILVTFDSLLRTKGSGGTVYYWP